jgi:hypothetical protein
MNLTKEQRISLLVLRVGHYIGRISLEAYATGAKRVLEKGSRFVFPGQRAAY